MTVAELIERLKAFPPDLQVAAMDTTNTMCLLVPGGITLEEKPIEDCGPWDDSKREYHSEAYVEIVGSTYTSHGDISHTVIDSFESKTVPQFDPANTDKQAD